MAFAETVAEQDVTQVQLKMKQHGAWSYNPVDAKNPIFISKRSSLQFWPSRTSRPAGLFSLLAQWPLAQPL
jgi:hypothetical protein